MRRFLPSHRNPETDLQLEMCEVCTRLVPRERLRELDIEGLRGVVVCDMHPDSFWQEGYLDFKKSRPAGHQEEKVREQPISSVPLPWAEYL